MHEDGHIISVGAYTHWMNGPNLNLWIEKIVHHAHEAACARGNPEAPDVPLDPKTTFSIVHIDAYPVHIDKVFIAWMKANYATLLLVYVPANCTGVMQIGHLMYNRPLKHHFTSEHMAYLTSSVSEELESGEDVQNIKFDTAVSKRAGRAMLW